MNQQRPALLRILYTDYLAFMALLFPAVFWIILLFGRTAQDAYMFYITVAMTAVAIPLLLWRIFFFIKMFDTGVETPAVIQGMSFYRSRGRVGYTYTFNGAQYAAQDVIFKIGRVKEFASGEEVVALVDPNNPKRAIIKKLYL
jgi:hypothetical protein